MATYLHNVWQVLLELSPWLLFGTLAAGILHVTIPRCWLRKHLGGRSLASTTKASILGVPLPLCSCSVIPTALGLRKDGASDGASISFMISTPQTGVDSIAVSWAMLGWPFAVFKVCSAFVMGVIGGTLVDLSNHERPPADAGHELREPERSVAEVFRHGFGELLHMIWLWVLVGVLVSALISTLLPADALQETLLASGVWAMLFMLLISLPLYVCATASVPVAAALVQAGMPTGAALVFLMAGPASNIATLGAVYRGFGGRVLAIYLGVVAGGSMLLGWLFNFVLGSQGVSVTGGHLPGPLAVVSAVIVLGLFAWYAWCDLRHRLRPPATAPDLLIAVAGMSCQNCANSLRAKLMELPDVRDVRVDLESAQVAIFADHVDEERLRQQIRDAGYDPA